MGVLYQDIRFALRTLRRSPGFTFAVILILALGIGANTAIFSLVNAVLLKSFPYEAPDRIVTLSEQTQGQHFSTLRSVLIHWRDHNHVFQGIAGIDYRRFFVTSTEGSPEVWARVVSPSYFSVMGSKPMLGRGFLPEEEQPGHEPVAVLSFAFWHEHMGGDPQAVGKSLVLNGQAYAVVGIMPAAFRDSLRRCAPFWVPLILDPEGGGTWVSVRARLKPGVTLAQAQAEMNVLEEQLAQADPEHRAGYSVTVDRFLDDQIAGSRSTLYLLWGAIGLVLLIACTNASGLFLVHSNVRRQEIAVRAALGASRGQLMRHMLTEGVILSVTAGVIGVLLAYWAIRLLIRVSPINMPRMEETRIDIPVLCFALGVSVVTGLVLSLLPAWKATSIRLSNALKQGQGGLLQGRRQRRLHGGLVVAQIGAASTLLMAVAMLTQSLISLQKTDLGFQPTGLLVATIELPETRYPDRQHSLNFYDQLLHRIQAAPGVQSAGVVSPGLYLGNGGGYTKFAIHGRPLFHQGERPMARWMMVSQDFFKTMGIPILRGRGFTNEDIQEGVGACIIDENLARKYFPNEDPIGQRIDELFIVGVASTLKDYDSLAPTMNTIFTPLAVYPCQSSDVVLRSQGDPMAVADVLRAHVAALDKDLELADVHTLRSYLAEMLARERYTIILLGLFAQVALILAAVGLFALLQYAVTQRTHEIGIRMALGATQTTITKAFLRQAVTLVLLGLFAGLLGGYIASRLMTSLLYDVSPTDPGMLAITLSILITTALFASYLPARRAAKTDPMQALRHE